MQTENHQQAPTLIKILLILLQLEAHRADKELCVQYAKVLVNVNQIVNDKLSIMKNLILILAIATLVSCKKETVATQVAKPETSIYKDTILNLKIDSNISNETILTDTIARQTLNQYFKNKGFMLQSEVDADLNIPRLSQNKDKNVIAFDTLLVINNHSGIVSYWNAKPNTVGHCVQPHHAIIVADTKNFKITNEDFLPETFALDSIKNKVIFGYSYNCVADKIIRKYKFNLKK